MEHISQRSFIQRRIWAINVRGRSERFLKNLVLTHLHTENTQFDTLVQDSGARYQARTDRLGVLSSLRPGYAVLI